MIRIVARVMGLDPTHGEPAKVGELVVIELPPNCTVHDDRGHTLLPILDLANRIGQHWRDQQGVNAQLLDELAAMTRPIRSTEGVGEHEFSGDECDCAICGEGRRHYLHTDRGPDDPDVEFRHG